MNGSLALLVLFFLPGTAWAAKTVVVAADGSGDFKTVEEAEKETVPYDTIIIRGPASEKNPVWDLDPKWDRKYAGEGFVRVTIVGQSASELSNFIIEVSLDHPLWIHGGTIADSIILSTSPRPAAGDEKPSYARGAYGTELLRIYGAGAKLLNCRIQGAVGPAVLIQSSDMVQIVGNVFTDNWGGAIRIENERQEKGQKKLLQSTVIIVGNTIVYNQMNQPGFVARHTMDGGPISREDFKKGFGIWIDGPSAKEISIVDNIIAFNDMGIAYYQADFLAPANNLFFKNAKFNYGNVKSFGSGLIRGVDGEDNSVLRVEDQVAGEKMVKGKNAVFDPMLAKAFRVFTANSPAALTMSREGGPVGAVKVSGPEWAARVKEEFRQVWTEEGEQIIAKALDELDYGDGLKVQETGTANMSISDKDARLNDCKKYLVPRVKGSFWEAFEKVRLASGGTVGALLKANPALKARLQSDSNFSIYAHWDYRGENKKCLVYNSISRKQLERMIGKLPPPATRLPLTAYADVKLDPGIAEVAARTEDCRKKGLVKMRAELLSQVKSLRLPGGTRMEQEMSRDPRLKERVLAYTSAVPPGPASSDYSDRCTVFYRMDKDEFHTMVGSDKVIP